MMNNYRLRFDNYLHLSGGIRLVSDLSQTCIRLVSDLCQTCIRLVSDLCQAGSFRRSINSMVFDSMEFITLLILATR